MSSRSILTAIAIWVVIVGLATGLGPLWLGRNLDGSYVVAYSIWFVITASLTSIGYVMHVRESGQQR